MRCLRAGVNAVAYETIREEDGSLPLLTPMSEVAGRMAVQVGAQYLEAPNGGRGILLGGVPGVAPANVLVLGGGVVGHNSRQDGAGPGSARHGHRPQHQPAARTRRYLSSAIVTLASNHGHIREARASTADLVIGAVLIPGASAPELVRRDMIAQYAPTAP